MFLKFKLFWICLKAFLNPFLSRLTQFVAIRLGYKLFHLQTAVSSKAVILPKSTLLTVILSSYRLTNNAVDVKVFAHLALHYSVHVFSVYSIFAQSALCVWSYYALRSTLLWPLTSKLSPGLCPSLCLPLCRCVSLTIEYLIAHALIRKQSMGIECRKSTTALRRELMYRYNWKWLNTDTEGRRDFLDQLWQRKTFFCMYSTEH